MIKQEFGHFQVQQEGVFGHALELLEAGFGKVQKDSMPLMCEAPCTNSS